MLRLLHSKTNQSVNSWISNGVFAYLIVGACLSTPLAILSKMSPGWFGNLNWAQAILFGIADALVVTLVGVTVLAIGAWAFRKVRPTALPLTPLAPEGTTTAPLSDDEALKEVVFALSGRVSGLIKDVEPLQSMLAEESRRIAMVMQNLDEKTEQVRVDAAITAREVEKLQEIQTQQHERTLNALYAVGARERLAALEASMEQDAADLYDRLKAGEKYDEEKWGRWENVHSHWAGSLQTWLETAQWYAMAVKERTQTIDEKLYKDGWSIDEKLFPNAEAVRLFKKHRIIRKNWLDVVPHVKSGIDNVAFAGMSEKDVRSGRPPG
jgi:hypothetical protein